jgi:hypothetical protein
MTYKGRFSERRSFFSRMRPEEPEAMIIGVPEKATRVPWRLLVCHHPRPAIHHRPSRYSTKASQQMTEVTNHSLYPSLAE